MCVNSRPDKLGELFSLEKFKEFRVGCALIVGMVLYKGGTIYIVNEDDGKMWWHPTLFNGLYGRVMIIKDLNEIKIKQYPFCITCKTCQSFIDPPIRKTHHE